MRFFSQSDRIWEHLLVAGLFFLFSLMLYFNSMKGEFHFDDYAYIVNAPQIRDLNATAARIFARPFYPDRSLVEFSFALNYAVHGLNYKGYQIVNVLVQAANVFLLYLLLIKLLEKTKGIDQRFDDTSNFAFYAFFTSLLFLVHPLAVNSVAYITQRHGLMATLFYLPSLYCYIYAMDSSGWKRTVLLIHVLFFFLCAIHCKPMALTLPLVLISYSFLFVYKPTKHVILASSCLCTAFAAYSYWYAKTIGLLSSGTLSTAGFKTEHLWSARVHFMTEVQVFLQYLKLIVMPLPQWLCADRLFPLTTSVSLSFLAALLVHLLIFSFAIFLLQRGYKLIFFGITWFYLTLLPYLFVPIQDVMVDYKTYLPSAGLIILVGEAGYLLERKYGKRQIGVCTAAILVFLVWTTAGRVKTFETEINFWTDVINKGGNQERALNNRGLSWKRAGKYSMAIKDFSQAIALFPKIPTAYANAGDLCLKVRKATEAIEFYKNHLRLLPKNADAHLRIGNGYMAIKQWAQANKHYHKTVQLDTANAIGWYNLGLSYARMKKWDQAKYSFRRAVKIKPDYHQAYASLGVAFFSKRKFTQAEIFYKKALHINKKFIDAIYNLAILYIQTGDKKNASEQILLLEQVAPKLSAEVKKQL